MKKRFTRLFYCFLLINAPFFLFAQSWEYIFPDIQNYSSPNLFQSPDGGFLLVAHQSDPFAPGSASKIIKIAEDGIPEWGTDLVEKGPACMLSNGDIILGKTIIRRYNQNGDEIWSITFSGEAQTCTVIENDGRK